MDDQHEQLKLLLGIAPNSATASAARQQRDQSRSRQLNEPTPPPAHNDEVATPMQEPTKPADFETMIAELEKVVAQLEGELKLEEALGLFERGIGLSQACEKYLQSAQQRIEILKRSSNGEVETEVFIEEAETVT